MHLLPWCKTTGHTLLRSTYFTIALWRYRLQTCRGLPCSASQDVSSPAVAPLRAYTPPLPANTSVLPAYISIFPCNYLHITLHLPPYYPAFASIIPCSYLHHYLQRPALFPCFTAVLTPIEPDLTVSAITRLLTTCPECFLLLLDIALRLVRSYHRIHPLLSEGYR